MMAISYPAGDYATILELHARYFNVPVQNNRIVLPAYFGEGFLEYIPLPMNIQGWLASFSIADDLHLVRQKSEVDFINLRFDILESDAHTELLVNNKTAINSSDKAYVFINNTRIPISYKAKKGTRVKSLNLQFDKSTIQTLLKVNSGFSLLKNYLIDTDTTATVSGHFFLPASPEMIALLKEIFELAPDEPNRPLKIFNRSMLLIEHFVQMVQERQEENEAVHRSVSKSDYEAMLRLEASITKSFRNELPPQHELAEGVYMSVSKLKYTFKTVFGTSIYNHYQKARMQKALELLQTGKSLAQIADELGFKDPTSFTRNFRKEFQLSPRKVRRLSAIN